MKYTDCRAFLLESSGEGLGWVKIDNSILI